MNEFWKGFASCFDIFGLLAAPVDLPKTDEEAFKRDLDALSRDHDAIMTDMLAAVREPQCENYVMSKAEAKAFRDPARRHFAAGPHPEKKETNDERHEHDGRQAGQLRGQREQRP